MADGRQAANARKLERGMGTFVEVGNALLRIRDERLYRASHKTFELYCRERWGMSKRHANRLVASTEVVSNLGPIGPTPTSESEARPLAKLPAVQQAAAWQEAVETAPQGKVTAR
jgi:hypothetical protein